MSTFIRCLLVHVMQGNIRAVWRLSFGTKDIHVMKGKIRAVWRCVVEGRRRKVEGNAGRAWKLQKENGEKGVSKGTGWKVGRTQTEEETPSDIFKPE